jgi:membrane associated rhomboid family serine protease
MVGNNNQMFRFLSHAFVHGDIGHLAFNMITLYFFGSGIEGNILSGPEFLLFYIAAIIFASLPAYQKNKNNSSYTAVGASGAVSAVMFVTVLYQPWAVVYIKFIIPIYFILFAVGYLIYSTYQSKHGKDNVAHDVHLWGALFGIAYMLLLHPDCLRIFLNQVMKPPFL